MLPAIRRELNGKETDTIDARQIYKALGIGKEFAHWIKDRIQKCGLVENRDYVKLDLPILANQKSHGGDRKSINYFLTIRSAITIAARENKPAGFKLMQSLLDRQEKIEQLLEYLPVIEAHRKRISLNNLKFRILEKARRFNPIIFNLKNFADYHKLPYRSVLATLNGYYYHSQTELILQFQYQIFIQDEHKNMQEISKLKIGVNQ